MKRSIEMLVVVGFFLFSAGITTAQTTNLGAGAQRTQEQSLQELVNEVRQLRTMLQLLNTTVYRTNVVVERMKLQQELVSRGSRDLDDVREKLADTRVSILRIREVIKRLEADVETGAKDLTGLAASKLELENAVQLEMRLVQRETQLTNDLSIDRLKLFELNDKLNKLEMELTAR